MRDPDQKRGGAGLAWVGVLLLIVLGLALVAYFSPDAGDTIRHVLEAIFGVMVGIVAAIVGVLAALVGVLAGVFGILVGVLAAVAAVLLAVLPFLVPVVILVAIGIAIGRSRRKG